MRVLFSILLTASLCLTAPVQARDTLSDLAQLDIIDGGMTSRGTYLAALRINLSDGWKTYWRSPGDAGIPPRFDWRGSRNVGELTITWPAPDVFEQSGMRSIGYHDQLVLPVEITPGEAGQPVRLRGQVEIGLCKDVCIPGTLDFDHELDRSAPRNPAIAAALAQRPFSASEAGVRAATCKITPTATGLQIEARVTMPSAGGIEIAVMEPDDPNLFVSEAVTTRSGNNLVAVSELEHVDGSAFMIDRSRLRITVLGGKHSVDIRGCDAG